MARPTLAQIAAREREVPMLALSHRSHVVSQVIQSRQALCGPRRKQNMFEGPQSSSKEARARSTRRTWTTTGSRQLATTPTMAGRLGTPGESPKGDGRTERASPGRTSRAVTRQTREGSHERLQLQCVRPLWRTASSPWVATSSGAIPCSPLQRRVEALLQRACLALDS